MATTESHLLKSVDPRHLHNPELRCLVLCPCTRAVFVADFQVCHRIAAPPDGRAVLRVVWVRGRVRCLCVCVCVRACVCVCCVWMCMHTCMYVCMHVWINACVSVCVWGLRRGLCVSEYTCAYVALCTICMSRWNARLRWSYSVKCVCYVCNYTAGLCVFRV